MAIQPRDRQKMKHQSKVAKRTAPKLVNRSNKTLLKVWVPYHGLRVRFVGSTRFYYFKDWY